MAKSSEKALTGVHKRQQIESTNKNIFLWVAIASVIISICLVALQFLVKEFMFNNKIINAKNVTNGRLIKNKETASELKANVNKLLADSNLSAVPRNLGDSKTTNLNVVLDALPVEGDATSFANSLQTVVLPRSSVGISQLGTNIDQLSTDGVGTDSSKPQSLPFTAGFAGPYQDISKALADMAKVVRPINLTRLEIRATDNLLNVTVSGVTYYLPARTVNVTEEPITP